MDPSEWNVEAFGLLSGDVWAPEHPSILYNRFFNMAGSNPWLPDDVAQGEVETDEDEGGVDWSHLIPIIDDLLEEEDIDGDEAAVQESADKDHGHSVDDDGVVLLELPEPDDAAVSDENIAEPSNDDKATREETPGTTFCFTTAAVAVPAVVAPSAEECAPVTTVGTGGRSTLSKGRRLMPRKKAPSLSLGAENGESSLATELSTARADAGKGLADDLGRTTAEAAAAAAPPRRSTARSARGRNAETDISVVPASLCFAPEP